MTAYVQALMLAASADGVAAIELLLKHGATIELQVGGHSVELVLVEVHVRLAATHLALPAGMSNMALSSCTGIRILHCSVHDARHMTQPKQSTCTATTYLTSSGNSTRKFTAPLFLFLVSKSFVFSPCTGRQDQQSCKTCTLSCH